MRAARNWLAWFINQELAGWWVMVGIIFVGAIVTFMSSPRKGLDLLGGVAALSGFIKFTARHRGIAAWPTRAAHEKLLANRAAVVELGEGQPDPVEQPSLERRQ